MGPAARRRSAVIAAYNGTTSYDLRMRRSAAPLSAWSKERIDAECGADYRIYESALIRHYTRYFAARCDLRCPNQPHSARTVALSLPPGFSELIDLIPPDLVHTHVRSGRSSQALALSLLGCSALADPSLSWFLRVFGLEHLSTATACSYELERALLPTELNEYPRVTKLDFVVENENAFVAVETKWSEPGLGICSCIRDGDGNPAAGHSCAARVRGRTKYWKTADALFGLPAARLELLPCTMSVAYQAVRNVAAARRLAAGRTAAFVLIYDQRNPYFDRTGNWPGWPTVLSRTLQHSSGIIFKAIAWQRLISLLPLPVSVREWAVVKHLLR